MHQNRVTLIRGDGIGPEIAHSVQEILEAAKVPIVWEEAEAGLNCIETHGTGLPASTLESVRRNRLALKGPTTTPIGSGHKSINVTLRKTLDLFASVRPAKSLPGIRTRFENVDILLIRENIEDTYGGMEHWQSPQVAQCLRIITRPGSMAVCRFAFETARSQGRRRVTCVHKANIHKITDGLFLECFRRVAAEYPEQDAEEILIDNACMQLVTRPEHFEVLVLPNLFGDVVSDLCAGLVGGLGVAPGANIGHGRAIFEAVHGSAPDIAGRGVANPTALILTAVEMLHYLGLHLDAQRVETALRLALVSGIKTRDLGGHATTEEFTRTVISALPRFSATALNQVSVAGKAVGEDWPKDPDYSEGDWTLHGLDVFFRHPPRMPELPERIGPFQLEMVANRGTRIHPGDLPDILLVDCFQARYVSLVEVSDAAVNELLAEFSKSFVWTHVEKLHRLGEHKLYSEAQGE